MPTCSCSVSSRPAASPASPAARAGFSSASTTITGRRRTRGRSRRPRYIRGKPMSEALTRLAAVLEARKGADPSSSYVAGLYAKGLDAILKKIGEEATATELEEKDGGADKIIHEIADLWFHTLVLLAQQGLHPDDVLADLDRRCGLSGVGDKAQRPPQGRKARRGPGGGEY